MSRSKLSQTCNISSAVLAVVVTAVVVGVSVYLLTSMQRLQPTPSVIERSDMTEQKLDHVREGNSGIESPAIYAGVEPEPYPCEDDSECQWGWTCRFHGAYNQTMCLP